MKIALLPGGFKPPHLGHYNMAKYLADFADKVIVRIGQKERDGIGKELSNEIWHFYKEFDPDPRAKKLVISVAQSPSPVKDVYDFVAKVAPEGSTLILGMGEKDASDGRYNSIPKFAEPRNITADIELVPPQAGGISGTRMREIIKSNDKAEFFKYIPDYLPEEIKEEIWTKLQDTTLSEVFLDFFDEVNQKEINEDIKEYGHIKEYNLDLNNTYDYSNNGDFWVFYDDKNDLDIYVKLKDNRDFKEFKFYPDPKSGIGFGKLKHHNPKNLNTIFNILLNEVLPKYSKILIQPADNIRYRLFKALINNNLSKEDYDIHISNNDDPIDGSPKIVITSKNLSEFGGGTMNQQEMNKHLANMKKLRKFFSKQGDQMVQVPSKLTKGLRRKLYEGRYDAEGLIISRFTLNQFKENLGEEFEDTFEIGLLEDVEYTLELAFYPNDTIAPPFFRVDAASDKNALNITINYDPSIFPKAYNALNAELKDSIRHELEHLGQFNFPKDVKYRGSDPKGFDYYSASYEIPAFVQGIYKKAKTTKIPFSQALEDFLEEREDEMTPRDVNRLRKIYTDYAKKNLPAAQLNEGVKDLRPKMQAIIKKHRISAEQFKDQLKKGVKIEKEHTSNPVVAMKIALDHIDENPKYYDILSKVGLEEVKVFSKEWWSNIISEDILKEGGAAGHMAHPFDLPNVKTGKDLIKSFEQAAESLKKEPGSVKIDGVNASIRLVNFDGKREFAMDRGSKKALDLKGVTKADLEDRFGPGHGMIKAGGNVLDIFNAAMNTIQPELKRLGLWDNPNIMFNMEYVSGKSNVQDYGKNFLAIHGLLEVETKEVVGKSGKTLTKRVTSEANYNQSDLDALLKKLEPFAKKKGFEAYGSVPTTFTKDPDFRSALNQNYTIDFAEGDKTKSLVQWLNDVTNIPKTDRLKMNVNGSVKDVGALSKQVYFAVFGGENVDDLFDNEQDVQKAIQGATTYLATEKLGDAILDVLDSPMGSVNDHEGVVIRDTKISSSPFKITGKFITGGVSSQFQQK